MSAAPPNTLPPSAARHKITAEEYAATGFGTKIIHIGSAPDPVTGAVVPPISLATTFAQPSPGVATYEYSRSANPSREAFEAAAAAAEGGKHCMAFSSGLAASTTILHMFKSGDHIISIDDVYGGTQRLFRRVANPVAGMEFSFVDFNNTAELEAAFKPNTKMLWLETPTNPTMKISDIEAVAKLAHSKGAILVVDNTFATPFFQNPLKHGADLVLHSITKYINGHSDVVGGIVITSDEELHTKLRFLQNSLGAVPSPFDCYLALRGIKTLHVRMERHASNAMAVAQFLEAHPYVEKVYYPGLASHPQHAIAKKQMIGGFGGMITFYIKGGIVGAKSFLENVKVSY
jgi:cystathionine gamma-lyase